MSLSWTPVLKGKCYCSPACGNGCTLKEHLVAHAIGKTVLGMLKKKKGWKIRVWENLGWHVQLQKGGMNLHIHDYGNGLEFHTLLSRERGGSGGNPDWTKNFHSKDPNIAIAHQLRLARKCIRQYQNSIKGF